MRSSLKTSLPSGSAATDAGEEDSVEDRRVKHRLFRHSPMMVADSRGSDTHI